VTGHLNTFVFKMISIVIFIVYSLSSVFMSPLASVPLLGVLFMCLFDPCHVLSGVLLLYVL